jgi:hypothetical protein
VVTAGAVGEQVEIWTEADPPLTWTTMMATPLLPHIWPHPWPSLCCTAAWVGVLN